MLDEKKNLPAVLQSLGCIAQTAMSVFETRENEIEGFIKREILARSHVCILTYHKRREKKERKQGIPKSALESINHLLFNIINFV